MPVAQVNGVRLNYVQVEPQEGDARDDLVMVHGLAANLAFWYLRYASVFAQQFRVTLLDLRGHGRSEAPARGYTPRDLGNDLRALLDHLHIERAHFVTHSYGGVVAMNLAVAEPTRVASLVLADTHIAAVRDRVTPGDWAHGPELQAILNRHGLALETRDPYFGYRLLTEVARLQKERAEIPPALLDLVGPLLGGQGSRTANQWLNLMQHTSAERELMGDDGLSLERLRAFRFPILAMYGDLSQARLTGRQLLDVWPHAEFRRIPDAGHFFPTTKPEEVIANCQRFWGGEFAAHRRAHRVGEPPAGYFRSDRIFQSRGAWFFATREATRVGPFTARSEAEDNLAQYITRMTASA